MNMKRLLFIMLGILCSTITWCADGDTFTANTIEGIEMSFRVIKEDDKTCEVYAYTETTGNKTIIHQAVDKDYSGDITIPSVVNGYSVIGLSDYAFSYTNISLINIPTGVMYIGNKAFEGCIFQSITLPEGLKNIGSNAFMSCKNLESINIPQSVETIGFGAFVYCSSMEIINLPSGNLKNMGGGVFQGCKKLKKIEIPEGVTSIGKKDSGTSFIWNCKELESITLPSTLLSINEELLGECPSLSKIIVKMTDPTILNIESSSLIYVYDSPSIYETARLYVPNGSKAAYQVADYWKDFNEIIEFLPVITFADANVKAICVANWDTDGDGELSEAEAAAVTDLGQVFKNNTQITSFEELHFFTGLTSIGTEAFYGCTNLSTVTMPNSITSIGNLAFWSCRKITTILIPNNVTSIGKNAFTRCIGLTSVTIPDGLLSIEEGAFISCDNLISFNIPNSVSSIGNGAFSGTAWLDNQPDGLLYVGNFLYGYKGLIPENSVLEIKEGTKGIVDQALYGGSNISSITLPNSIVYIGKRAFQECSGISSIIIPNSVTTIGEGAFYCCTNLASITISNSLTSIEDNTFVSCSGLTSVTIPNSVTNIGKNAFASCDNLSSLEMPNSVTSIGIGAFKYCTSLTFVDIPNSVISINGSTFEGCASLLSVTIPNSVTAIGDFAFENCNNLLDIYCLAETVPATEDDPYFMTQKATLHVPNVSLDAYKTADYWKKFKFIVGLDDVVTDADRIYCDGLKIYQACKVDLEIKLANEHTLTAYQFDLVLPEGITLVTGDNGKYLLTKSDRYSDNSHQVNVEKHDNNTYRIMCVSMHNGVITGNDGVILTLTLEANQNIAANSYNAEIRDIVLTAPDETKMKTKYTSFSISVQELLKGDSDGDGEIDVTDVVATINYILGKPSNNFNIYAADMNNDGEVDIFDVMKLINLVMKQKAAARNNTRAAEEFEEQAIIRNTGEGLILGVNSPDRFTAFQFDVEVADDVELLDASLTANTGGHKLYFLKNGQNTYRVIGISMNNCTLITNGADLVELKFSKSGNVMIDNITFVTPQETKVRFAGSNANVTGIGSITIDQQEDIFDLSGRKIDTNRSQLPKGVYIINNKKVVIK